MNKEIAVIYFRHGYAPPHFDDVAWEVKLLLERSRAIKCPTIHYMLANTKMVQKALCDEQQIRHYANELGVDFVDRVLSCFAGLYDLHHQTAVEQALLRQDDFVLKPQREGGGNNYFGDELRRKLLEIRNTEEMDNFVLMRRLYPLRFNNVCITPAGEAVELEMVSELGSFGVFIGEGKKVYENYFCGYLLRTKPSSSNEGGIYAGAGCLDSPFWVDMALSEDGSYKHDAPFLP